MRIAIDIRSTEGKRAGKGWYTYNLINGLLKIDKKNQYIFYGQKGLKNKIWPNNVEIKLIKSSGILWHLKVIIDVLKSNIDVFFAPSSFIIPALLSSKIKSLVTVHDLVAIMYPESHNKKAVYIENLLLKRVCSKASKILAVSKNTKNDLLKKFDIKENKIDILYCSADTNFRQIEVKEVEKFFMAVGTISPRKNYINLIKAFSEFYLTNKEYRLKIIGSKGWQFNDVFKLVKELKIEKFVVFMDYVDEKTLIELYNKSTALIFPSLYEGFGIPPLEAMMCGCPVIATNASSVPEVVGNAALLIDPNSIKQLSDAMQKISSDKLLRDKLIIKGFEQSKKFSWDRSAEKLLKIFSELI